MSISYRKLAGITKLCIYRKYQNIGNHLPCLINRHQIFNISTYKISKLGRNLSHLNICKRYFSHSNKLYKIPNLNLLSKNTKINLSIPYYLLAIVFSSLGLSYAAVPLYKIFCRATGYGNVKIIQDEGEVIEKLEINKDRVLRIQFSADTEATMKWNFEPQQHIIYVHPGETVLAFYRAKNPTDKPIIGVSTYTVLPYEAGPYLNKIQCFCFEEQMLNPNEEVDMPVFFYIDPEYDDDPKLEYNDGIHLNYTFFEVKDGMSYILPKN